MSASKRFVIACVIGTRPEVIKMAPVYFALKACPWADVVLINTAQHRGLLDDMLAIFSLKPDMDLDIMTANQSLGQLTGRLCLKLDELVKEHHFDAILAQGDTTTVMVSSLIAFYHNIPFGHIEAGLRTHMPREPFPEEINRILAAPLSTWHFVPTAMEEANLLKENIDVERIAITGNTVIDALYWVLKNRPQHDVLAHLSNIITITTHRRENFGTGLQNICQAIVQLAQRYPQMNFVFPVHPNPNVREVVEARLGNRANIHLIAPMKYDEFAHLMNRSILMLTDSGGIQEEAPALNKPVVVMRRTTERPAIITEGVGVLAGVEADEIVRVVSELLDDKTRYDSLARGVSPYGDGQAAGRIVARLQADLMRFYQSRQR